MSSNGEGSSSAASKKKSVGRRKLPMEKIQRESNRQVTFSKRRMGVFKKASELCTLTGSEAAVVVFSPANKVYSYGHPNVHDVMNRVMNYPGWNILGNEPENPEVKELMSELARKESQLEATKARTRELQKEWDQMAKENKLVTPSAIKKMSYEELKNLKESMLMLRSDIQARMIEKQRAEAEAAAAAAGGGQSSNAIPFEGDHVTGDGGGIADGGYSSEDSVVELIEDGVGRRFF